MCKATWQLSLFRNAIYIIIHVFGGNISTIEQETERNGLGYHKEIYKISGWWNTPVPGQVECHDPQYKTLIGDQVLRGCLHEPGLPGWPA